MKVILPTILVLIGAAGQPSSRTFRAAPLQDTQGTRILALIDHGADSAIEAPTQARIGEDFQVTVTSFGGGGERVGDTAVIITEGSANLLVYDFTSATRPGVVCTMRLKRLPHIVKLRFPSPGEKVIRIWGRRVEAVAPSFGVPVVLEHRITVRS